MKIFMLKCVGTAGIMFIIVLAGMQLANEGIHKMKGYEDLNFQNAIALDENEKQLSATFLGNEISSHHIDEKKRRLEEMSAFNFFSTMGKSISDGVVNSIEKIINLITE
jgi:hypothetical protein